MATRHEDCGTCVQIVVNQAKGDGVRPDILKTTLTGRVEALADGLADVYRFAEAVVGKSDEEGPPRERLRARYGDAGVVELAVAIAVCRVFPTKKRALGYATSCTRVTVEV